MEMARCSSTSTNLTMSFMDRHAVSAVKACPFRGEQNEITICHDQILDNSFTHRRMTSDMTDDESSDENFPDPHYTNENHNYTTLLREQLQEFPGRVPQRKRKSTAADLGNASSHPQQQQQKHKSKPKVREGKRTKSCSLLNTPGERESERARGRKKEK
jgi:hypothetical protein